MGDWVGQTVGRYYLIEALGQGGMATVYRAYDTRLRREVAVKFIRRDLVQQSGSDEPILKRFEREAVALGKLSHPNIVNVHDYGEHNGIPYLVMEFVEGGTLKKLLGRPIDCADAARLLAPVARALDYAHQRKLVHRDVKPANILLTEMGAPKLSDFGIARIVEAGEATLTTPGVGIGTPEYMAPEQSLSGKVDARADIYSLGIVYYEMITGQKPFRAETPMAVMLKHLHDPLPRPSSIVHGIPDDVERILFRALAKQPDDRYPDMGGFARDLERVALASAGRPEAEKATLYQQHSVQPAPAAQPGPGQPPPFYPPTPASQAGYAPAAQPKKRPAWLIPVIIIAGLGLVLCLAAAAVFAFKPQGLAGLLGLASTITHTPDPTHTPRPTRTATEAPADMILPSPTFAPTLAPTTAPIATRVFTPTSVPTGPMEYVVQAGDTYFGIAQNHGMSLEEFLALNSIADQNAIYVGQVVLVSGPTPVPGGAGWQLAFADDFSNPNTGFGDYSGPEGSRGYDNGQYFINDLSGSIWAFSPGIYGDIRAEVDWVSFEGSDVSTGIFCRYNGDSGADAYMAVIYYDGTYNIQKFIDNANFILQDWSVAPSFHQGATNRLAISCVGNVISFYVNGEQIATVTDTSLSNGFTGFAAFRNSGASALANFDNFAIYAP